MSGNRTMVAEVEQLDGSYKTMELIEPTHCFYCDTCGDCLKCQYHDEEDWCNTGGRWVVYLNDPLNPNFKE
jgi:Fe2+ or Zn2+ uptake regulation protein